MLPPVVAGVINPLEVRILAGHQSGDYTDRLGRIWQSDRYFHGGTVFESRDHPIFGTREPKIYQSRREGTFSYDIPLAPGTYELRLHFAETLYGENNVAGGGESSRVFNVWINGKEALHEFDVIAEVGPSTADVRAFKDISPASDGKLHLRFEPFSNPPLLSAIEIVPGTPGRLRPIRMLSLDRMYIDRQGRAWEPDRYARGGQLVARTQPVEGAADPELFRGERYRQCAVRDPGAARPLRGDIVLCRGLVRSRYPGRAAAWVAGSSIFWQTALPCAAVSIFSKRRTEQAAR